MATFLPILTKENPPDFPAPKKVPGKHGIPKLPHMLHVHGIFTYWFTINLSQNIGKYTSPMDPIAGFGGVQVGWKWTISKERLFSRSLFFFPEKNN